MFRGEFTISEKNFCLIRNRKISLKSMGEGRSVKCKLKVEEIITVDVDCISNETH